MGASELLTYLADIVINNLNFSANEMKEYMVELALAMKSKILGSKFGSNISVKNCFLGNKIGDVKSYAINNEVTIAHEFNG